MKADLGWAQRQGSDQPGRHAILGIEAVGLVENAPGGEFIFGRVPARGASGPRADLERAALDKPRFMSTGLRDLGRRQPRSKTVATYFTLLGRRRCLGGG
jgi:hypothetical protein